METIYEYSIRHLQSCGFTPEQAVRCLAWLDQQESHEHLLGLWDKLTSDQPSIFGSESMRKVHCGGLETAALDWQEREPGAQLTPKYYRGEECLEAIYLMLQKS